MSIVISIFQILLNPEGQVAGALINQDLYDLQQMNKGFKANPHKYDVKLFDFLTEVQKLNN